MKEMTDSRERPEPAQCRAKYAGRDTGFWKKSTRNGGVAEVNKATAVT
jgi:hypothetical protein